MLCISSGRGFLDWEQELTGSLLQLLNAMHIHSVQSPLFQARRFEVLKCHLKCCLYKQREETVNHVLIIMVFKEKSCKGIWKMTPLYLFWTIWKEKNRRSFLMIYKAQRNALLCGAACLLYWSICAICKYNKKIQSLEEVEKKYKDQ
ncbi:hypothetical protein CK203_079335 [Vitis vinifera]|uniref:Uncharacterized protein n=1 Tax=Vitis vinifera TaxID=29760 RepID=A0A438DGE8_VITVI|nr:hypothetical protein CK203_079335 [Vitis vinifera]